MLYLVLRLELEEKIVLHYRNYVRVDDLLLFFLSYVAQLYVMS